MTSFRFPLQRVLEWRRTQLEIEETRFRQATAAVAEVERLMAEAEAAGVRAEVQIRQWRPVTGGDLWALDGYRFHVRARERELEAARAERKRKAAAQQAVMLEARRRLRLLERLRERRLEEWRAAEAAELETLASESYLARWARLAGAARGRGARADGGGTFL